MTGARPDFTRCAVCGGNPYALCEACQDRRDAKRPPVLDRRAPAAQPRAAVGDSGTVGADHGRGWRGRCRCAAPELDRLGEFCFACCLPVATPARTVGAGEGSSSGDRDPAQPDATGEASA